MIQTQRQRLRLFKKLKAALFLSLMLTSLSLSVMSRPAQAGFWDTAQCVVSFGTSCAGKELGSGLGSELGTEIRKAMESGFEVGIKPDTIRGLIALTGYTRMQISALSGQVSDDLQDTLDLAFDRTNESAELLNILGKDFVSHGDTIVEARIKQAFDGLNSVSNDLNKIILTIGQETRSSFREVGSESRLTIRSARDNLAALLEISSKEVDFLLQRTGREISGILYDTSQKMAELIELTSQEAQDIIRIANQEAQGTIRVGSEEFRKILQEVDNIGQSNTSRIGEEVRKSLKEGNLVVNSVLEKFNDEFRLSLKHAETGAILFTNNLSQETQAILGFATENVIEVVESVSDETKELIYTLEQSSTRLINRSGEIVVYTINRMADLLLALFSACAGLLLVFVAAYGWGKTLTRYALPSIPSLRIVIFSLMGATLIAAFTPFAFLKPSLRAQVLAYHDPQPSKLPAIPEASKVIRAEPDLISIQELSYSRNPYLRLSVAGLREAEVKATFGHIKLPVHSPDDYSVMVDLFEVYQNPHFSNRVEIQSQGKTLYTVPVKKISEANVSVSDFPEEDVSESGKYVSSELSPSTSTELIVQESSKTSQSFTVTNSESEPLDTFPRETCGHPNPQKPYYRVYADGPKYKERAKNNFCKDVYYKSSVARLYFAAFDTWDMADEFRSKLSSDFNGLKIETVP